MAAGSGRSGTDLDEKRAGNETGDPVREPEIHRTMRADAAKNHARILEAAEQTFAREGIAVPIDVVAERAGVGVGTLYRHFPTKEALYEAIVIARLNQLLELAGKFAERSDPGDALFEFIREFAKHGAQKRDLFEALSQAGIDIKSQFSDVLEELMERIDGLRQRAAACGAVKSEISVEDILHLVVGSCDVAGKAGVDDAGLQRMVNIVIAGIQP